MSKTVKPIKPADLNYQMRKQLTLYHADVMEKINEAGETAVKKLVKKTKATAPERTGDFKKNITWKRVDGKFAGTRFFWYVKSPLHRITHLLVNGYAKQNGGRVPGDPFLQNALDEVLPEYEKAVKEALHKTW